MAAFGVQVMDPVKAGPVLGGYIDLTADDWFDSFRFARPVEVDSSVHDAVVGDCHCGLAQLFYSLGEAAYFAEAIKKAVFCMDVEVDK